MASRISKPSESFPTDTESRDESLSQEQIEEIVRDLNGICRSSSLEFALRIGAVIIHHFYDGDPKAWRVRGPKINSFRRLAEHPELQMSAGALYRCVAIFELCERLHAASRWRRLGASHLRTVLGLEPHHQVQLLTDANEQRWSVQVLQARVQALKSGRSRGGRRAQSPLERRLRTLDTCLRECEESLRMDESQRPDVVNESLRLLTRMKQMMGKLARDWTHEARDAVVTPHSVHDDPR
jgi:hypothetical protein